MEPLITVRSCQVLENESDRGNLTCLGSPLILRAILQCFSTKELIQLSLVNKQWNNEARSLMRNRGNLTACINKNHTCQDLRDFASDIRRMKHMKKVIPFSGMTIKVGGWLCANKDYCQQSPNGELEPVYEEIIASLTWKHLKVRHLPGWEEHKSCPGFILSKKILRKLDSVLEEFSIQLEDDEANSFKEEFLQDCYFSRLKTFQLLNDGNPFEPQWADLIKTVVSKAPNLQVLYTEDYGDSEVDLLEGSSAVHVTGDPFYPSFDKIRESIVGKIRLRRMSLSSFSPDISFETFNRITPMLLQSSRTVMTDMQINLIFLAPLMNYDICMENVREVELLLDFMHVEDRQPSVWRIAKSFDFTRIFPKLNTVNICDFNHRNSHIPRFSEMIEQVNAALRTPSPDRVAYIKHLKLSYLPSQVLHRRSHLQLLAQLFPNIQKLSIATSRNPFTDVLDIWVDLKQVDIIIKCSVRRLNNLDGLFCGIFPEEVAYLQEQDDEYLRRVNIVPVMPSAAYLKQLSNIEVYCEARSDAYTGPIHNPTCLLSKVTALIVFQRCPHLTVTLTSEDERLAEALGHLRPYASVIFKKIYTSIRYSYVPGLDD